MQRVGSGCRGEEYLSPLLPFQQWEGVMSNGPPYHVNRKEALAKTAWFLCISNISNFIKIFPTMHLRVRN